jgi:glycosyltransferase involved in cell wall biosynthesis
MYSSFAASATLGGQKLLRSVDLNVVYASPATAAAPALVSKLLHGVPFVLIVQDVWPDSVFAAGFLEEGPTHRTAYESLNRFVNVTYRHASHIVVISEGMKRLLLERGVDDAKVTVIYNWADEEPSALPLHVPHHDREEQLHLMYAGNIGAPQGLDNVLRAFALLPRDKFHLTIVGGGSELEQLKTMARQHSLTNVEFLDPVPASELRLLQSMAHIHLVSLNNDPLFHITVPSKLQSLLAAGAPILAVASGEVADVVSRVGAGLSVPPGDPEALARSLTVLLEQPTDWFAAAGLRGRTFYETHMSRASGESAYRDVIGNLAPRPK